jgi:hypothetical protein
MWTTDVLVFLLHDTHFILCLVSVRQASLLYFEHREDHVRGSWNLRRDDVWCFFGCALQLCRHASANAHSYMIASYTPHAAVRVMQSESTASEMTWSCGYGEGWSSAVSCAWSRSLNGARREASQL